jgi:hypothetical protein
MFEPCKLLYKLLLTLLKNTFLRNLFFERAEEVIIHEEQEEKNQVMAATEVGPWELSPAIRMPGMTGRRTSEGYLENLKTI